MEETMSEKTIFIISCLRNSITECYASNETKKMKKNDEAVYEKHVMFFTLFRQYITEA